MNSDYSDLPVLAVTMGDAAGVGPEVILKALAHVRLYDICKPVVIGDQAPLEQANAVLGNSLKLCQIDHPSKAHGWPGTVDYVACGILSEGSWHMGKVDARSGDAAYQYVVRGVRYALDGVADAVVTAPISKEAIHLAGHSFSGHTEILAHHTGVKEYGMLLAGAGLHVIHVTTHVSMEEASRRILCPRVLETIRLGNLGMQLLGYKAPRVAVAGLNPHCSENGLFGSQEAEQISPAIEAARMELIDVTGPYPGDTVFVRALAGEFDLVVAMYHDQGHIPVKLLGFRESSAGGLEVNGINCTIGLPFIRTSVDHGTAFDIAGTGSASELSMIEAMEAAAVMSRNRLKIISGE